MKIINRSGCRQQNKQKYFSDSIYVIIDILNYLCLFYFVFSHIFWIFSLFDVASEKIISSDKKSNLLYIFNYLFMFVFVSFGFLSVNNRSIGLFTGYFITLILINVNFMFEFRLILNFRVFNKELGIINSIFNTVFSFLTITISLCLILNNLNLAGYLNLNFDNFSFAEFIEESKLKLDLLKIKINSFIITFGVHRVLPFIMFKKSDLYFMTADSYEINHKISKNNSKYENISPNFLNSFSTMNSETEPLKR